MTFFCILVSAFTVFGQSELQHFKITPAKVAGYSLTGYCQCNVADAGYFTMKKIKVISAKHGNHYALVDDEDFERVNKYRWNVFKSSRHKTLYAHAPIFVNGRQTTLRMHRLVMGIIHGKPWIYHKDHNGLNNQKSNLRFCNQSQNSANSKKQKNNTSGFKGVTFATNNHNWVARIGLANKKIWLGAFNNKIDAAKAYNEAAIQYFGEFARLNKIPNE